MSVTAFAIHKIGLHINGKKQWVEASTKGRPSVFTTDDTTFAKLKAAGACREASEEEIAVAKVQGGIVAPEEAAAPAVSAVGDERPASGAEGDPQAGRNGRKKAATPAETPAAAPSETPAAGSDAASKGADEEI